MGQITYVFQYTETSDFENPVEISMAVPERSADEMCEFFQRFLQASGYLFENYEHIGVIRKKDENDRPGCGGDILTFNPDGTPFCYDFGDDNNSSSYGGTMMYGVSRTDSIKLE